MFADGELPNLGLQFLHGFGAHRHGPRRDREAEEGKAVSEKRQLGPFRTRREAELGEMSLDQFVCLLTCVSVSQSTTKSSA